MYQLFAVLEHTLDAKCPEESPPGKTVIYVSTVCWSGPSQALGSEHGIGTGKMLSNHFLYQELIRYSEMCT